MLYKIQSIKIEMQSKLNNFALNIELYDFINVKFIQRK